MNICIVRGALGPTAGNRETEEFFARLKLGERIWLKVLSEEDQRSLSQNSLYWKWVAEIVKQSTHWDDKHDLHETLKERYALPILVRKDEDRGRYLDAINAKENEEEKALMYEVFLKYAVTTRDLGVKGFSEFLDDISRDATRRGIILTYPEDLKWA